MSWYIVILFMLLIIGIGNISGRKLKLVGSHIRTIDLSMLLTCMVLFVFAALRATTVGADTRQQQVVFELCREESWGRLATSRMYQGWFHLQDIELGYKFYCKLLSLLSSHPQTVTVVNSVLVIFLLYQLVERYSHNKWLSVFIFYTFGFYQTALNMTPSTIASLIVMNAFVYIEQKKIWRYLLCILAGCIFHYSVVIFIPLYFVCRMKLSKRRFWTILAGMFISVPVAFGVITTVGQKIIPKRYLPYLELDRNLEQMLVYVVQFVAVGLCLLWIRRRENAYEKTGIDLHIFLVESLMYFLTMQSIGFSRAAFLFSPYVCITIPNLLFLNMDMKTGTAAAVGAQDTYRISKKVIIIVAYSSIAYIMRIWINNIGGTMPYQFCF